MAAKDKLPRGRLLIIEDDWDILEVLKLMLEGEGHHVVTAKHGREALAVAADRAFDMVVMDISMPEMSGIEVAEKLRAGEKTADIGIAIHTGLDEHWVRDRFADYDLFLTKATDTDILVEEIAKFLAQPKMSRSQRRAPAAEPTFTEEEAMRARQRLRTAMSVSPAAIGGQAFVRLLSDEIEQLRKLGRSDGEIAALVGNAIGRDFSAELIEKHAAAGEARGKRP